MAADDVVVTGLGLVSGAGTGLTAQLDFLTGKSGAATRSLAAFRAAPLLSDKRMMKAISHADAVGLAAIELLKNDADWESIPKTPERIGMYVGAPPAGASDNAYYMDAQRAAAGSIKAFGKTCLEAKPTTLLIGLPNNVLCYGAMLLDARGPNNNYTSSAVSGMVAVTNGAKRVARGQLDVAVAGGFCAYHADPVNKGVLTAAGLPEEQVADGAAFVSLERRCDAVARGAKVHATIVGCAQGSDALGPWGFDPSGAALEHTVRRAMEQGGLAAADIALVMVSESGHEIADAAERAALGRVFAKGPDGPAWASLGRAYGGLMEAGGVMELGLAASLAALDCVPAAIRVPAEEMRVDAKKQGVLVLRTSLSGDYICLALSKGVG